MRVSKAILIVSLCIFLSACSTSPLNATTNSVSSFGCPDGIIEWVDMVMISDIKYMSHFPEPSDEELTLSIETGNKLGEVTYKMAGSACSNHKMQNGDATYAEIGSSIYEVKGIPSSLAVQVNDKVFVVETNEKAKTAGALYPLEGLVSNIYMESTEDGRKIHAFSPESVQQFIDTWNALTLEDVESLGMDGSRVFLQIELHNGIHFRQVYWRESNTFSNGAIGTIKMKEIIDHELSAIE